MAERVTFTISGPDGEDEIELPAGLVDMLGEEDDESQAQVVGDITTMAFASRAHMIAHHGEGESSEGVEDVESEAMDLFEERFGMTYGEATGHQH
ncbi:DUF7545 family protein [Halocalculus aciditolerans]|uniref:Uncharacterized protein n=1 Tax=Halocalculus aciditolerans TaxID=1383812 RepID=A0A830F1U1_9EURY|nr:hypothetical protein [Halocalculus aciditolerans]GGL54317.1 hypothetical protein GCM10009039_10590 [Halocalculus aciditolerans]